MFWIPNSVMLRNAESKAAELEYTVVLFRLDVAQFAKAKTTIETATM